MYFDLLVFSIQHLPSSTNWYCSTWTEHNIYHMFVTVTKKITEGKLCQQFYNMQAIVSSRWTISVHSYTRREHSFKSHFSCMRAGNTTTEHRGIKTSLMHGIHALVCTILRESADQSKLTLVTKFDVLCSYRCRMCSSISRNPFYYGYQPVIIKNKRKMLAS